MPDYTYTNTFQQGEDPTEYRLLTTDYVTETEFEGQPILKVDPKGLELLAYEAFTDVSFFLRSAHLASLRRGLDDPEASENDIFVAKAFLETEIEHQFRTLIKRLKTRVVYGSFKSDRFRQIGVAIEPSF